MTLLGFGEGNLVFFDFEFSYVSIIGASISVFLGIVMTQSGFDKIFNWEGELDFITVLESSLAQTSTAYKIHRVFFAEGPQAKTVLLPVFTTGLEETLRFLWGADTTESRHDFGIGM